MLTEIGAQVPEYSDHRKYYVDKNGKLLLKSEPYDLDLNKIKKINAFCKDHYWTYHIYQGYETHYPGRTFTVLFDTGYNVPNGSTSSKS